MMSEEGGVLRPHQPQHVAPPRTPSGQSNNTDFNTRYRQLLGLVRDVRAEVQNLRTTLEELIARDGIEDEEAREKEIKRLYKESGEIFDYNAGQIEARLQSLRLLMDNAPILYDYVGDEITHIENHWERARQHYPSQGNGDAADVAMPDTNTMLRETKQAVAQMDLIIYHAGLLTIPPRLKQHLKSVRIGQALDFHATFKDEVPIKKDRDRILKYLGARPVAFSDATINAESGIVFRVASAGWRRTLSYIYILIAGLLGALLTYALSQLGGWFDLAGWPFEPDQAANMLVSYGFVVAGGVIHLGVDAIKQSRSDTSQSVRALDDWYLWVHINERGIVIGIVYLWIALFGLLFLSAGSDGSGTGVLLGGEVSEGNVQWQTAFLVGYSVDSFVDMFLQRFSTTMKKQAEAVNL